MEIKIQELIDSNKKILQYINNEKTKELMDDHMALIGFLFAVSSISLLFAISVLGYIVSKHRRNREVPVSDIILDAVL